MNYENLERVKQLYSKGFRCIKYEEGKNGDLTVYFKHFENESIDMVASKDKNEISNIKNYIQNI